MIAIAVLTSSKNVKLPPSICYCQECKLSYGFPEDIYEYHMPSQRYTRAMNMLNRYLETVNVCKYIIQGLQVKYLLCLFNKMEAVVNLYFEM